MSPSCWRRRTARSLAHRDWPVDRPDRLLRVFQSIGCIPQSPPTFASLNKCGRYLMALSRFCSIIMLTAGLVPTVSGVAGAAVTDWVGDSHAAVRLITATDSVAADSTLEVGLEFRFAKGWHGYWRTPGDAGVAPLIDWSGSENIARHDIAWPAPRRLVIEDLQNSVYDNHVVLPVKLLCSCHSDPVGLRQKPSRSTPPARRYPARRRPPVSTSSAPALRGQQPNLFSWLICSAKTGLLCNLIFSSRASAVEFRQRPRSNSRLAAKPHA
jgi:hypothetical protein